MLGIKKALELYKAFPDDPYVIIPKTSIELRFDTDGAILGAYKGDTSPAGRWMSKEFEAMLEANRNRRLKV